MTQSTFFRSPLRAGLIVALTSTAAPLLAQDAQVSPPPVTSTVPTTAAPTVVAPPPVVRTVQAPAPAAAPASTPSADEADATPAPRARTSARAAAPVRERAVARPAPRAAAPAPAPVAAAAPAAVAPAAPPVTETAPAAASAPAAAPAEPAAPAADTPAATTPTDTTPGVPLWPIGVLAVLLLGAIAAWALLGRRRRVDEDDFVAQDDAVYEETYDADPIVTEREAPTMLEPTPVAAPAIAPVASASPLVAPLLMPDHQPQSRPVMFSDEATADPEHVFDPLAQPEVSEVAVSDADAADVEALAAAADGASGRASLDFAMRPIRAGTTEDDAVVEFELTVVNTGDRAAEDVRTFATLMSASSDQDDEIMRFLDSPSEMPLGDAISIAAGDARKLEATLTLPRAGLHAETINDRPAFVPLLVIETRYRSGAGQGRISAAFRIGTSLDDGEVGTFFLDRRPAMWDNVEAQLHRVLERA